jgi:hypothetical protein
LNQHCVDRSDLNAIPAAGVAHIRSFDVILAIRLEEGQGGESFNQLATRLGPGEALQ